MAIVLIVNGFLESGKTTFIKNAMSNPRFAEYGKTLLIACEEGEMEYDEAELRKSNIYLEYIQNEADFQASYLMQLDIKHAPERILIEWNGTWDSTKMILPFHWEVQQQVSIIDGETFDMYYSNMRSIMMDMLKKSELIIFNRCDKVKEQLPSFKRNVMLVNQNAQMIFEGTKGRIQVTIDEELPYDINSEYIELSEEGYVSWYMHCMEAGSKYIGKQVKFVAQVMKHKSFPKGFMVPGRQVMTCCADDISFVGYPCKYENAEQYESGDWVELTVRFTIQSCFAYKGKGPVLEAVEVCKVEKPKQPVIGK